MKTLLKPNALLASALLALLVSVGALTLPVEAAAQDLDLTGEWVLTVESPNGTGERNLTLVQDGETLSGEIMSPRASGELSGTVEGDQVMFVAVVQMDSGAFEITYIATITDGKMRGTVDFGDYGSGSFTGRRAVAN